MTLYKYNSTIRTKYGCIDCPEGNLKPIYASKRCAIHYKVHRSKKALESMHRRNPELKKEQDELWKWYQKCIEKSELRCAECGNRIVPKQAKEHWSICHVLPKRHFKSIQTNDDNWIELCWQCHSDYDSYMENHDERLMHMRIFKSILMKIQLLKPFITEKRKFNNLPEFILEKL